MYNTWSSFHSKVEKLINIFIKNGYPRYVIDKCINQSVSKKVNPSTNQEESKKDQYINIHLPYFGLPSLSFKKKLLSIYRKANINVRIVFKSFKVGNYFSLKSLTPLDLKARIVYQYDCSFARTKSYIG